MVFGFLVLVCLVSFWFGDFQFHMFFGWQIHANSMFAAVYCDGCFGFLMNVIVGLTMLLTVIGYKVIWFPLSFVGPSWEHGSKISKAKVSSLTKLEYKTRFFGALPVIFSCPLPCVLRSATKKDPSIAPSVSLTT